MPLARAQLQALALNDHVIWDSLASSHIKTLMTEPESVSETLVK